MMKLDKSQHCLMNGRCGVSEQGVHGCIHNGQSNSFGTVKNFNETDVIINRLQINSYTLQPWILKMGA